MPQIRRLLLGTNTGGADQRAESLIVLQVLVPLAQEGNVDDEKKIYDSVPSFVSHEGEVRAPCTLHAPSLAFTFSQ